MLWLSAASCRMRVGKGRSSASTRQCCRPTSAIEPRKLAGIPLSRPLSGSCPSSASAAVICAVAIMPLDTLRKIRPPLETDNLWQHSPPVGGRQAIGPANQASGRDAHAVRHLIGPTERATLRADYL